MYKHTLMPFSCTYETLPLEKFQSFGLTVNTSARYLQ